MKTILEEVSQKHSYPVSDSLAPMDPEKARKHLAWELLDWSLSGDGKSIRRTYVMAGFKEAVDLIEKIKDIAEAEDHHPDLHLTGYRNLTVEFSTHSIGGLSVNESRGVGVKSAVFSFQLSGSQIYPQQFSAIPPPSPAF